VVDPIFNHGAFGLQGFSTALPAMQVHFDDLVVDGSRIEFHWTFTGTNTGPGGTGNADRISGYEEWTIIDGLIARSRGHDDAAEYARQLAEGVWPQRVTPAP
jgi:predicted ester cyclase